MLIVGVLFGFVDKKAFEIQIASITGFIILILNFFMITIYCSYSGMPYKSDLHAENLKHVGIVTFYWTLAFIIKLITSFIHEISPDQHNIGHMTKDKTQPEEISQGVIMFNALLYFGLSIICDVMPFIISLDSRFMEIFTFDSIFKHL